MIWDPARRLTYGVAHAHHRTDYNLYEGWELVGFPEKVYLRGNLIVDGDQWLGQARDGDVPQAAAVRPRHLARLISVESQAALTGPPVIRTPAGTPIRDC